jgi:hypothetical protein
MSKINRLLFAGFTALAVVGLVATPDPELNTTGSTNPVVLVVIAVITAVATLRILKKLRI